MPQQQQHRTGFSLRESLIFHQGVTLETEVKRHLNRAYETIVMNPGFRVFDYKV